MAPARARWGDCRWTSGGATSATRRAWRRAAVGWQSASPLPRSRRRTARAQWRPPARRLRGHESDQGTERVNPLAPSSNDSLDAPAFVEVALGDAPHVLSRDRPDARLVLGQLAEVAGDPRVHHVGQNGAAALLANGVHAYGVLLRALELFVQHGLVAQSRELAQESLARHAFLLRRGGDVRSERAGRPPVAGERVHGVAERLLVTQL